MIACDAGYEVCGSDREASLVTQELAAKNIDVSLLQDGHYLRAEHAKAPFDWFIHTAALPNDHPELVMARQLGIRTAKRDELLANIIEQKSLKLIAVTGTHGKTTTTGMLVWALQQLDVPASYSIGSTLSFGASGVFVPGSDYFVYECDEFDRNFLHFSPWLSVVTTVEHDHADTYPTEAEYYEAFRQFGAQSHHTVTWSQYSQLFNKSSSTFCHQTHSNITLAGAHNRANATLVLEALRMIATDEADESILEAINSFPGTSRRFEKLADNLYSDYGHHPTEIAATLQMARELADSVVLVYQPHQNIRQHEVQHLYTDCMSQADHIYWLPTYLSREDPALEILQPEQLTQNLTNRESVSYAQMDDALWHHIQTARSRGQLVLGMGAGSIDGWLRGQATK